VLLFGRSPQNFFVEAQLKCGRFKGIDSVDFEDEQTYEGPILSQLDAAMAFVGRHTRRAYKITGRPEREVIPEYPEDAVREALINALCHRNYATVGTIQVRIYDDRIEIWNPGHLPPEISLRKLYQRHASYPGNPLIAQSLYRARLIEHWGTGTLRIIKTCRKANIKVAFEAIMGAFIVTLKKQPAGGVRDSATNRHEAQVEAQEAQVEAQEAQVEAQEAQVVLTVVERNLLAGCQHGPKTAKDLLVVVGYKNRTGNFKRSLTKLIETRLLELTMPDKPNSRFQKYRLTDKGRAKLAGVE
jgi:predicted HTH transcriptional regulator